MQDRPDRADRLAALVAHAERVRALAGSTTCHTIRVLGALTPADVAELGRWHLRAEPAEAIVDRVTAELGESRPLVRGVLGDCLRLDVWGDYECKYAQAEERYRLGEVRDHAIERKVGRPPACYPFLLHRLTTLWRPAKADCRTLCIEDNRMSAVCDGYLVARGLAFPTRLSLLEASLRGQWKDWPVLWGWF